MNVVVAPLSRLFALVFTLLFSLVACAEDGQFKAGQHYQVLPQAVPQKDDSRIEVTEMFWYGCGHCYHFEPTLNRWKEKMPEDVALLKIPAIWQPLMEVHARMYYVADTMGVLDRLHAPIFNAINNQRKMFAVKEGRNWNPDLKAIEELFNAHGADGAKAAKLMNSFTINSRVKQGMANQRAYQLSGTPEVVVAGKYRISTSLPGFKGKSNGQELMLQVADYLIAKERAERS
ncbi:thiol:disulfide interchange protein DsbA/DsbL [Microbulbifer thermotolerans]|uniref:Thiol:disulfide interchange protein n=1 Tax=Microbulbifer thermotolerans TaxID=252514 RepID=A0A143HHT4_MICTH|nr:thiol:disulfide interchange protein DsbA/DsbL [Microbulbifer thermotolerans]AMX01233.1 disulfide bond formation protein DsbA [Microbulbifer thermotolerans]MCX2778443.1 thiol:disulfide interchange protein DsbA/DsbL [Microbulbifer thermotolerans]MCX2805610.1 thiol:disulfide interchange protein DsbA/DsbL [Microbulbifer thermotolerans]